VTTRGHRPNPKRGHFRGQPVVTACTRLSALFINAVGRYAVQARQSALPQGAATEHKRGRKVPVGVRFYAEDMERLNQLEDRSAFIRDAVHKALQNESNHNPA
jgi:hypothetical protein